MRSRSRLVLALAALVLPTVPAAAAADLLPTSDVWIRALPAVVWADQPVTRIEVHILHRTDVKEVRIKNLVDRFYDDGTHGDARAGDGVFTADKVRLPVSSWPMAYDRGLSGEFDLSPRVTLKDGTPAGNDLYYPVVLVNPSLRGKFPTKDLGNGLSASATALFIQDKAHRVMSDYPVNTVICGRGNYEAYKLLYSVFPDVFDVAVVTPAEKIYRQDSLAENVPYEVNVTPPASHLGLEGSRAAEFGSKGRLLGTVYMSFKSMDVFDHEIGHVWSAHVGQSLGLLGTTAGHWSDLTDLGGQMGEFYFTKTGAAGHFRDNGNGTWTLTDSVEEQRNQPYSPLELYLMGLIPSQEVPPFHVLTNPNLTNPGRVTAASVKTVTIADLIKAAGGERVPSAATSPKSFNVAYLVVDDQPFGDAAVAYFSMQSAVLSTKEGPDPHSFAMPFYWATGGRATLDSQLPGMPTTTFVRPPVPLDSAPVSTASVLRESTEGTGTGALTGQVVWNERPVPGASVRVYAGTQYWSLPALAQTVTDNNGEYRLEGLAPGKVMVWAFGPPNSGLSQGMGLPAVVTPDLEVSLAPHPLAKAITGISPASRAAKVERRPILRWDPVPGAERYLVRIFHNTGNQAKVGEAVVKAPQYTWPSDLEPSTEYQWDVSADTDYSGTIAYAAGQTFTTGP